MPIQKNRRKQLAWQVRYTKNSLSRHYAPDSTDKTDYKRYLVTAYKALAGFALLKKDDTKAKEYFDKVLAIDPNDESVKRALEGPKAAPTPTGKPTPKAPVKKKVASK